MKLVSNIEFYRHVLIPFIILCTLLLIAIIFAIVVTKKELNKK